jgi:hypothetical protein
MLRKMLTLGAIVVVAVTFGVGSASAKPGKGDHGSPPSWSNGNGDGFSDGR